MKHKFFKIIKLFFTVIQIPIKIALLVFLSFHIFTYLDSVYINREVNYGDDFRALPKNSMDVITLGSSQSYYSFVPSILYQKTGLYSYDMGSELQPLSASYEMLKECLKTQTPKVVLLEVYSAMPLSKVTKDDACYILASYYMTGEEKFNVLKNIDEKKREEYYVEFLNNHNNWRYVNSIEELKPKELPQLSTINPNFGYSYHFNIPNALEIWWYANEVDTNRVATLDDDDLNSLNNIYELCKDKGITLILYKTPMDGIDEENQAYINAVWEWANSRNIKYIDFIKEQRDLNFLMCVHSDSFHSYVNGAGIITDRIIDEIKAEGIEFDHKKNEILNSLYQTNGEEMINMDIYTEYNPKNYIKRLENYSGTILFRYRASNDKISENMVNCIVSNLGLRSFDGKTDCFAIIENGKIIKEDSNKIEYELNEKKVIIDENDIIFDGQPFEMKDSNLSLATLSSGTYDLLVTKNVDLESEWDMGLADYRRVWE